MKRGLVREWTRGLSGLALTLTIALVAVLVLLYAFSDSFAVSAGLFFLGPFRNVFSFGNMINASAPLILAGLAMSVAFGSRNFNLGGEGQIYSGAMAATAVCLWLPETAPLLVRAAALLGGAAAGGMIGGLSGYLKRSLDVDEMISSFLASAAIVHAVDFIVTGPFQDAGSNFQTTSEIARPLWFAKIMPPSNLTTAIFLGLAAALILAFVLKRTRFGFELRICGYNRDFARYCGIRTGRYTLLPMILSGALYGLAGGVMILGTFHKTMRGFSAGLGWSGIAVALIARNNPLAVIPSALFFAWLEAGAKSVMIGSNVTSEIIAIVQAVIFFLITAQALGHQGTWRIRGKTRIESERRPR